MDDKQGIARLSNFLLNHKTSKYVDFEIHQYEMNYIKNMIEVDITQNGVREWMSIPCSEFADFQISLLEGPPLTFESPKEVDFSIDKFIEKGWLCPDFMDSFPEFELDGIVPGSLKTYVDPNERPMEKKYCVICREPLTNGDKHHCDECMKSIPYAVRNESVNDFTGENAPWRKYSSVIARLRRLNGIGVSVPVGSEIFYAVKHYFLKNLNLIGDDRFQLLECIPNLETSFYETKIDINDRVYYQQLPMSLVSRYMKEEPSRSELVDADFDSTAYDKWKYENGSKPPPKDSFLFQYTTSAIFEFEPGTKPQTIEIPPPNPEDGWELAQDRKPKWKDDWRATHFKLDGFTFDIIYRTFGNSRVQSECNINHLPGQLILKEFIDLFQLREPNVKVLSYSIYRRPVPLAIPYRVEFESRIHYDGDWPERHPPRVIMESKKCR